MKIRITENGITFAGAQRKKGDVIEVSASAVAAHLEGGIEVIEQDAPKPEAGGQMTNVAAQITQTIDNFDARVSDALEDLSAKIEQVNELLLKVHSLLEEALSTPDEEPTDEPTDKPTPDSEG